MAHCHKYCTCEGQKDSPYPQGESRTGHKWTIENIDRRRNNTLRNSSTVLQQLLRGEPVNQRGEIKEYLGLVSHTQPAAPHVQAAPSEHERWAQQVYSRAQGTGWAPAAPATSTTASTASTATSAGTTQTPRSRPAPAARVSKGTCTDRGRTHNSHQTYWEQVSSGRVDALPAPPQRVLGAGRPPLMLAREAAEASQAAAAAPAPAKPTKRKKKKKAASVQGGREACACCHQRAASTCRKRAPLASSCGQPPQEPALSPEQALYYHWELEEEQEAPLPVVAKARAIKTKKDAPQGSGGKGDNMRTFLWKELNAKPVEAKISKGAHLPAVDDEEVEPDLLARIKQLASKKAKLDRQLERLCKRLDQSSPLAD